MLTQIPSLKLPWSCVFESSFNIADSLERWLVIYQQKQIPIQEKKLREAEEKREDSLQTCDDLMLHITNTQNE